MDDPELDYIIRWYIGDFLSIEEDMALIWPNETGNGSQDAAFT